METHQLFARLICALNLVTSVKYHKRYRYKVH